MKAVGCEKESFPSDSSKLAKADKFVLVLYPHMIRIEAHVQNCNLEPVDEKIRRIYVLYEVIRQNEGINENENSEKYDEEEGTR